MVTRSMKFTDNWTRTNFTFLRHVLYAPSITGKRIEESVASAHADHAGLAAVGAAARDRRHHGGPSWVALPLAGRFVGEVEVLRDGRDRHLVLHCLCGAAARR